jgi:hypothetical protein
MDYEPSCNSGKTSKLTENVVCDTIVVTEMSGAEPLRATASQEGKRLIKSVPKE